MSRNQEPILVVGAGPAGLALAIALLLNGLPVRIIQRELEFHGGTRGTAIQPRSLEALKFLGVVDDVVNTSTPPLLMAIYDKDGWTSKTTQWSESAGNSPNIPYPETRSLSQAELEKALRKRLEQLGGDVEKGKELVSFKQDGHSEGMTAQIKTHSANAAMDEETIHCRFLVGADGSRSCVRKTLNIPFTGKSEGTQRIFVANVHATGADREHWQFWGERTVLSVALKPLNPAPLFQLQALGPQLPEPIPEDLEGIRSLFRSVSQRDDIVIHHAECASEWRANVRMAERFSVGHVFLVGDAGHCHSPFGGQGLNTAIQDSINLAWKIGLVYRGLADEGLLRTYDIERMPVVAEMLGIASNIHSMAFSSPTESTLETGVKNRLEEVMFRPQKLLQLGINYRWSPIVFHGDRGLGTQHDAADVAKNAYGSERHADELCAGDRAPDAPLLDTTSGDKHDIRLFDMFEVNRHLILRFLPDMASLAQACSEMEALSPAHIVTGLASAAIVLPPAHSVPKRLPSSQVNVRFLVDKDAHARRAYFGGLPAAFVVIRPDGVVGCFAETTAGVDHYFTALFNCHDVVGHGN